MLSKKTSVARFAISPAVTAYDFDFPFWDFSEIYVNAVDSATGESVTLVKDVDYSITVSEPITDPVYLNGTITMLSDVYKNYTALVISRELPMTQDTDYKNGEPINADTLEMSLDRATAQIQQVAEDVGHSLKLPSTENPKDYTIPEASQRKRMVLGFSDDGTEILLFSNPDDSIAAAEEALAAAESTRTAAENAKNAAEEAQTAAEAAQAAAEEARNESETIRQSIEETTADASASIEARAEEIMNYLEGYRSAGYAETIGDGVSSSFTITHNLHTMDVVPTLTYFESDTLIPFGRVEMIDEDNALVTFDSPIAANSVRILFSTVKEIAITSLTNPITADDVDDSLAISSDYVSSLFA